jgi:hypothetical protein
MRPVVRTEEEARRELDPRLSLVLWREADLALPFERLGWDRFEIFCYLLLKREHPGEEIVYYGKTGDRGRDIVRYRADGSVELIQCKSYSGNVGVGEVRKELAKLFTNLHSGEIPINPDDVAQISFYASPDLTADAKDLLRYSDKWREVAEKALREHLEDPPSPDLLQFALSWWPKAGFFPEIAVDLTQRAEHHKALIEEFFRIRKVVDGSVEDVVTGVREGTRIEVKEGVVEALREIQRTGLVEVRVHDRTWKGFFAAAGQENAAFRYLTDMAELAPDQRFEPPREYSEILKSVHEQPLTFLIGPPAVGKTFTALQILWDAYRRGLRVRWIAPEMFESTDGPVPAEYGLPDMKRRIEFLTRRLGLETLQAPLDTHDFIASNLRPGSIVYIEDPFGKRDDEFKYSLHTYSFFDLDAFVSAIDEGAARAGCHILVSSRHGLFDRWMDDRRSRGKRRPKSQLIRVSAESYSYEQRFNFAYRLAEERGLVEVEDIADEIASEVLFPYEIERAILGLPKGARAKEAKEAARSWLGDLREDTRRQISTEDDSERLFLLVTALDGTRSDYLDLHRAMEIPRDGKESLEAALARYRPFIVRQSLPFFRIGKVSSSGLDEEYYDPDRLLYEKFSPTHSSVQEAIDAFLSDHPEWIERVSVVLPGCENRYADVAIYVLSLKVVQESGPVQEAVASVLFDNNGLSIHNLRNFMRLWATFDDIFKDKFFQHLESDPKNIVREVAALLGRIEMLAHEAWRILRLLLREKTFGKSGGSSPYLIDGHPWKFLVEHFQEVPDDIRSALTDLAIQRPRLFTYVLGAVLTEIWSDVPNEFKDAFFHRDSVESDLVQDRVLRAIALHWAAAPQELRDFFLQQASSANPRMRAEAARAAWLYWDTNSKIFDPIYMRAVDDPDISVPLEVLSGSGDDDYTRKFAEKLFVRADEEVAACMLQKLLTDGSGSQDEWKARMMKLCIEEGGELALGVLAAHHFARNSQGGTTLYLLPKTLEKELEIVRLGALHAYAHDHGERSYLSEDEAIALVKGMNYPYRDFALYYLSIQVVRLPPKVRAYVESFEEAEGTDGEAVRLGKKERQPEKGPQTIFEFRVRWIAAMLKSQEAHP